MASSERFTIELEVPPRLLYKVLRAQIKQAVEAMPGVRFVGINAQTVPDRFLLQDPDKLPADFK